MRFAPIFTVNFAMSEKRIKTQQSSKYQCKARIGVRCKFGANQVQFSPVQVLRCKVQSAYMYAHAPCTLRHASNQPPPAEPMNNFITAAIIAFLLFMLFEAITRSMP